MKRLNLLLFKFKNKKSIHPNKHEIIHKLHIYPLLWTAESWPMLQRPTTSCNYARVTTPKNISNRVYIYIYAQNICMRVSPPNFSKSTLARNIPSPCDNHVTHGTKHVRKPNHWNYNFKLGPNVHLNPPPKANKIHLFPSLPTGQLNMHVLLTYNSRQFLLFPCGNFKPLNVCAYLYVYIDAHMYRYIIIME